MGTLPMNNPGSPAGSYALRPRGDNLALIYQESFTAIVRLRTNRQSASDSAQFRAHMRQLLGTAEQEAQRRGYSGEDTRMATFAVVAFLDESDEPNNITHPMVTNMGRFLQSLDADGDPENGITITEAVRNEISGRMIDFNQSTVNFENDPDVVACFEVLNALNMPHYGQMWELCPAAQARQHMNTQMCRYGYDDTGSSSAGGTDGDSGYHMMDGTMGSHM